MGHIEMKRGDGDMAVGQSHHIGGMFGRLRRWIVCRPVVIAAFGILSFDVVITIASHSHGEHVNFWCESGSVVACGFGGNIDVIKPRCGALMMKDPLDELDSDGSGGFEIRVGVFFERNGDAWDAKESTFYGSGDSTRVKDVNAGVQAAVDSRDN